MKLKALALAALVIVLLVLWYKFKPEPDAPKESDPFQEGIEFAVSSGVDISGYNKHLVDSLLKTAEVDSLFQLAGSPDIAFEDFIYKEAITFRGEITISRNRVFTAQRMANLIRRELGICYAYRLAEEHSR